MLRDDLSLRHLRLLKSLHETESLTRSAANLRLSRPSASRMLKELRELFDDELFLRKAGGLLPTARMRALYPEVCRSLEGTAKALFTQKTFDPSSLETVIRISALDNAVLSYLVEPISRIVSERPKIRFRISPFDRGTLAALAEGRIDFACFPLSEVPEGFRAIELDRSPRVLVVRRGHPLEKLHEQGREITPDLIAGWPRIRNAARGDLGQEIYRIPLVLPRTQLESVVTPYFTTQGAFAVHTGHIAFLPRRTALLLQSMYPGRLAVLPVSCPETLQVVPRLLWHQSTDHDPARRWIRGVIRAWQRPGDGEQ